MAKQPGKFKLAEAINPKAAPLAGSAEAVEGRPGDAREPQEAQVHQANAETNAGIQSNKERLVEIGRGAQAAGRISTTRGRRKGR
jgi:hypothetical protein